MGRYLWITDLHLDFASPEVAATLFSTLKQAKGDALLFTGDIGEADTAWSYLEELEHAVQMPIYFVLGNHDFYGGSLRRLSEVVAEKCFASDHLHYLSVEKVIELSSTTALIGHDGWADGRSGEYWNSHVLLRDFVEIEEFVGLDRMARLDKLHELADEAVKVILKKLGEALKRFEKVILVTHVPPFAEACFYDNHPSDPAWTPFFCCQALGEALKQVMTGHPDHQLLVLAGHTHHRAEYQSLPNFRVVVENAEYGKPEIQGWVGADLASGSFSCY